MKEANPIKRKYYQLPANTLIIPPIYYNKAMFASAGISATPKTWADLLAACAALKGKGITPFVTGAARTASRPR